MPSPLPNARSQHVVDHPLATSLSELGAPFGTAVDLAPDGSLIARVASTRSGYSASQESREE